MATLTKKDYKYFEMARKVAKTSDFPHFHLGCVIVYKGSVISSASNTKKTAPIQAKYNKKYRKFRKNEQGKPTIHSLHCEIRALKKIPYPIAQQINWRDVKVYIYRISPGKVHGAGMARCCPSCINALKDRGISQIYYTTDDGFAMEKIF